MLATKVLLYGMQHTDYNMAYHEIEFIIHAVIVLHGMVFDLSFMGSLQSFRPSQVNE